MKYPNDYINKVICGDCLEVMKGIPDDSVNLVLTDLPYGITACGWDVWGDEIESDIDLFKEIK